MKKIYIISCVSAIILLLFLSCGAIVDDLRVIGIWNLQNVEFYTYNNELDSTKIYTGINKDYPDQNHPLMSSFFCETGKASYSIEFDREYKFIIKKDNTSDIITETYSSWSVDNYNNSLDFEVKPGCLDANGFWLTGFRVINSWPMPNYQTLELTIKAGDLHQNYFLIDLSNDVIKVNSMKAIFIK